MASRLTVLGTGYLGATHADCMTELGHEVLGMDVDVARIETLAAGELPGAELTVDILGGEALGRRVAVLGAACKPDSDDLRDSPALHVAAGWTYRAPGRP